MLTHLSLFSGIGGIDLAGEWAGFRTVGFCEIDSFCQKVLEKHWPGVPIIPDIRNVTKEKLEEMGVIPHGGTVTLISGGFPCQPFSVAGKQRGTEDDRHLWPEMFRVISEVRPRWVLGENVAGFVRLALDDTLSDMESIGYSCQAFVIPACAVGAPHRRDRVWIVANAGDAGWEKFNAASKSTRERYDSRRSNSEPMAYTESKLPYRCRPARSRRTRFTNGCSAGAGAAQSRLGRDFNGLSHRLHGHWPAGLGQAQHDWEPPRVEVGVKNRTQRLKALGNAVVPQQAYTILAAIAAIEQNEIWCFGEDGLK